MMITDSYKLTADDCKALKQATSYSFNLNRDGADRRTTIRCYRKLARAAIGPFERQEKEAEYTIAITPYVTTEAHFYMMFRRGTMDAIAALVRPGDVLRMGAGPNNNQYMDRAELYHDELTITIIRPGKAGARDRRIVNELVVMSSQCPQNTARAVMSSGPRYSLAQ